MLSFSQNAKFWQSSMHFANYFRRNPDSGKWTGKLIQQQFEILSLYAFTHCRKAERNKSLCSFVSISVSVLSKAQICTKKLQYTGELNKKNNGFSELEQNVFSFNKSTAQ